LSAKREYQLERGHPCPPEREARISVGARASLPALARSANISPLNETDKTNLADRLRERIRRAGPITFRDWMQAALYDRAEGYYCRRRIRQGRAGDYRTAPETSPLFGAVFAHYFMKSYFDLGAPDQFTIIEIGGGAGDFARAVLTTLQREFPKVFNAARYIIDEISDDARSQALTKLGEFKDRIQFESLSEIESPLPHAIIFANELLDAFPVNRVIGRSGKLCELRVGLNDEDEFTWIADELSDDVAEYCERIRLQLAEGQIYEVNLAAEEFISRAAQVIGEGLLITVDYGSEREGLRNDPNRLQGTLRAFHRHEFVDDLLARPGEYDLTTTVDWTQIQEAGTRHGFETLRFQRLDEFLLSEGAPDELFSIGNQIRDPVELLNFNAGARELIMPNGMAASFQALVQRKAL
jgi:SAM-dependent MidA family methyltransferase